MTSNDNPAQGQGIPIRIVGDEEKDKISDFNKLQESSRKVLFRTKTVFPFTLYPDTIIIDYQKMNIIKRRFFLSESISSINHTDILHVAAESGPLFATLIITTKYYTQKPIRISYLRKKDAIKARDIIHGLISTKQENIAYDEVDERKLTKELAKIGRVVKGRSSI